MIRIAAPLAFLVLALACGTAAPIAKGEDSFKCLEVWPGRLHNPEHGNYTNGLCNESTTDGRWVIAQAVVPVSGDRHIWCAEVEPGQTAGVVGYSSLDDCRWIPVGSHAGGPFVRISNGPSVAGGKGNASTFRILPTVKTLRGLVSQSVLTAGTIATTDCGESTYTGEIKTMATVGSLVIVFAGCTVTESAKTCTIKSVGAVHEGEIITRTLKGELGTLKASEAATEVGLLVVPETTKKLMALASTPCSAETAVEGSIAAEVVPVSEKARYDNFNFEAPSAKQEIQHITVLSGEKHPELTAFGVSASEEAELGTEYGGETEIA